MVSFSRLIAVCVAGLATAQGAVTDPTLKNTPNALAEARDIFDSWKSEHGKTYEGEEHETRFGIFVENMKFIQEENAKGLSYEVGLNGLADINSAEFNKLMGYRPGPLKSTTSSFMYENTVAADAVDWRTKNAVTPVKNQGQCGSCWTFSATGSMEGIHAITSGKLVSLSEQEIVDCDKGGNGCGGGIMDQAFEWVISNGGIDTEEDYGYTAADGTCDKKKEDKHVVTISGHEDVPASNAAAMKKAVTGQPVSIAIQANQMSFQLYHGGVFSAECGNQLDHGVLVVGYTADAWIVKNSWGATWGEKGFIRFSNTAGGANGMCGMYMQASYPTASKEVKTIRAGKLIADI